MSNAKTVMSQAANTWAGPPTYIEDVFSTYLYTSYNSNAKTITNGIDLAGEGGMVWIKGRSIAYNHNLTDTERGVGRIMNSNTTLPETYSGDTAFGVSSFNSDGFTTGTVGQVIEVGHDFSSWTFRKAPRFFDVVKYTGTGVARSIDHNLGIAPGFIATFEVTGAGGPHRCWHTSLGPTGYMPGLEQTAAAASSSAVFNGVSDTTFTIGSSASINQSGIEYVAYLFAHDPLGPSGDGSDGLIACGSYTGGGSSSVDVNLGWEPQFIIARSAASASNWYIFDAMRGWTQGDAQFVEANTSGAERSLVTDVVGQPSTFLTSTGFQMSSSFNPLNKSGETHIYIAIRRGPMRQPTSGTEVFNIKKLNGTTAINAGFVVDAYWLGIIGGGGAFTRQRLTGGAQYLQTHSTAAEAAGSDVGFDKNIGLTYSPSSGYINWLFSRAPGFFDVVAYEGDGLSTSTFNHNLGVTPELMIIKNRDDIRDWCVYHKDLGATYLMNLNSTAAAYQSSSYFPAVPTETVFRPGNASATNRLNYSHINYLFATLPGVSKVGSYTGDGTQNNTKIIDCGFTSGARFVLIKRTDSTSNWVVFDAERGIVAGNDPRLNLNDTSAEQTDLDIIDPHSSGFSFGSNAGTNLNISGASYIYLAIA